MRIVVLGAGLIGTTPPSASPRPATRSRSSIASPMPGWRRVSPMAGSSPPHLRFLGRARHADKDPEMARARRCADAAAALGRARHAGWGSASSRIAGRAVARQHRGDPSRWRSSASTSFAPCAAEDLALRPQPAGPAQALPRPLFDGERGAGRGALPRVRRAAPSARRRGLRRERAGARADRERISGGDPLSRRRERRRLQVHAGGRRPCRGLGRRLPPSAAGSTASSASGDRIAAVITDRGRVAGRRSIVLALGSYSPRRRAHASALAAGLSGEGLFDHGRDARAGTAHPAFPSPTTDSRRR